MFIKDLSKIAQFPLNIKLYFHYLVNNLSSFSQVVGLSSTKFQSSEKSLIIIKHRENIDILCLLGVIYLRMERKLIQY